MNNWNEVPIINTETHLGFLFEREEFSKTQLKKPFGTLALNTNYLRECLRNMTHIVLVYDKATKQVVGFATLINMPYKDFIENNKAIVYNIYTKPLYPSQSIQTNNVAYISYICSLEGSKSGSAILSWLETNAYTTLGSEVVALHSLPSTYTYFTRKKFLRTNDMSNIYPTCNSRIYFDNEQDMFSETKSFLFMKLCFVAS